MTIDQAPGRPSGREQGDRTVVRIFRSLATVGHQVILLACVAVRVLKSFLIYLSRPRWKTSLGGCPLDVFPTLGK